MHYHTTCLRVPELSYRKGIHYEERYKSLERYREIGFRIAYCRKYQKMTQEELAEKLNVSRQHIGAIEAPNVNRKISLDLIFDIADILNVEPKYFLEFQNFPFQKAPETDSNNNK